MIELPIYLVAIITLLFAIQWIYVTASLFSVKDKADTIVNLISTTFFAFLTISLLVHSLS